MEDIKIKYLLKKLLSGKQKHGALNASCLFFLWFFVKSWGKLWFSKLICQLIIKVWSTFSKVVGVGKAHKYFSFMQSNDSQTASCLAA